MALRRRILPPEANPSVEATLSAVTVLPHGVAVPALEGVVVSRGIPAARTAAESHTSYENGASMECPHAFDANSRSRPCVEIAQEARFLASVDQSS